MPQNTANRSQHDKAASAAGCRRAEQDREQHGQRQPDAAVGDRRQQEPKAAQDLIAARRDAEEKDPEAHQEQPQGRQKDAERGETGEKLSEQQRVPIDRLSQDAADGTPVELAVDAVEGQRDGDDRDQEGEEGDE
jgi:hypothetical protein